MIRLTSALAALICLVSVSACRGAEPLVGFVNHFPWVDNGMDQVASSGSSAVLFRATSGIEGTQEGKLDFSSLDRQIDFAEKNNQKVVLLIESNPLYAPSWLKKKCQDAGEMMINVHGKPDSMPSMTSKVFAAWHDRFTRAVIAHVKQRDTKRVVVAYCPGAEWWYDAAARFNKGDIAAFRKWLAAKYVKIGKLNLAWKARYKSFGEVDAPKLVLESPGGSDSGLTTFAPAQDIGHDLSWSTRRDIPVTAGKEYVFKARARVSEVHGQGAHLSIAWRKTGDPVPVLNSFSEALTGTSGWREITLTAKAPADTDSAWLLLKLRGNGKADFEDVFFAEEGSDRNLAANPSFEYGGNNPDGYGFDNWSESAQAKGTWARDGGKRFVSISMPKSTEAGVGFANWSAAGYDWWMFSYEFFGDYIEGFCKLVKDADPSRFTLSYLTFSFGFPVEWDYVQQSGMALDVILPRLKHLDAIGMQICSANGDPVRITGAIDLARKYGKPVYAVDVIDFISGTHVGYPAMDAVTASAVRHGAAGLFYYCWYGTPDYNYYTGMDVSDLKKMLSSARISIKARSGKRVSTRVAVIEPILPNIFTDPNGCKNDFRDFVGLYKAVLGIGHCPDIWTVTELASQRPELRKRYDVVFLPDCAYCPGQAVSALNAFVKAGGKIVRTGRAPTLDQAGNRLSVRLARSGLLQGFGRTYLGEIHRKTSISNTPALFVETENAETLRARRAKMAREFVLHVHSF